MSESVDQVSSYVSRVERSGPATVSGCVYHRTDHTRRAVVELLIDGLAVALVRADLYRPDLDAEGIGDGRYGFSFVLAPDLVAGGGTAQVVLANLEMPLGEPLSLARPAGFAAGAEGGAGAVAWGGSLRLTGWLAPGRDPATTRVRALIDGEIVAEGPADRWRQRRRGGERAVPAFLLHLPERYADGLTKRVTVTDGAGTPLGGSPVTLVAFPDPLDDLARRTFGPDDGPLAARARLFDTLSPASCPLSALEAWRVRYPDPAPVGDPVPFAVIFLGDAAEAVSRSQEDLDGGGAPLAWTALPSPDGLGFDPAEFLRFLDGEAAGADVVVILPAGARLAPGAGPRLAAALRAEPEARLVYGDVLLDGDGGPTLLAFPSFDYERWLEQGYGARAFALPRAGIVAALQAGADDVYGVTLAAIADPASAASKVLHLPGIAATLPPLPLDRAAPRLACATAAHLAARGVAAAIDPAEGGLLPAIRVRRAPLPASLSLIVSPCPDEDWPSRLAALRAAVHRIGGDVILADDATASPAERRNRAVSAARGDVLVFLHGGIAIQGEAWAAELLGRLAEPSTGAVGAILATRGGGLRSGGLVLGPGFAADEALLGYRAGDAGPGDRLRVASEPSAVSWDCLMLRRSEFVGLGGFDALRFPAQFADLDLCLRLGRRGRRIVLTPSADLIWASPPEGGRPPGREAEAARVRDLAALRARWGEVLMSDPAASPLLSLADPAELSLACPPRDRAARRREIYTSDVLAFAE